MPEKKREAPPPATAAGLLRFFEDEAAGIKIDPIYLVIGTVVFIVISFVLRFFI
jgi:preprotein translocase subunit Sec61beta